jgi:hypothetical protein
MVGNADSERLKVAALNLFHPTASPLSRRAVFFILRHSLLMEETEAGKRREEGLQCVSPLINVWGAGDV